MRYFMPGKDGFPWLVGVAAFAIAFIATGGYLFPGTGAPEATPAAAATTPAPAAPAVFAPLPSLKTVRTESIVDFSGRIEPVEPSPPAATTASAIVVPEGPAAAPPAPNPARCVRYIYRAKTPKREYLFDDMESKYQAELAKVDRSSYAVARCLRQVVPNKGG